MENVLKSTLDFNKQFKESLSIGELERAVKKMGVLELVIIG
ncbi:hypothetical protein [Clostridium tetani]|nr:hypothetical protein [Clostridium tetani]